MKKRNHIAQFTLKVICIALMTVSFNLCDDNINSAIKTENDLSSQDNSGTPNTDDNNPDSPQPGNVGIIIINKITSSKVKLYWTTATDTATSSDKLQYKAYYSLQNNISRVKDIDLFGIAATNWQPDLTSCEITGLLKDTVYFFNVVVKDTDNNSNVYATVSVRTSLNSYPPIPGGNGIITAENILAKSLLLKWNSALDFETDQNLLEYIAYFIGPGSTSSSLILLDQFDSALQYGSTVMSMQWTKDIDTMHINDLIPNSTYCFNVYVRDEDNNIAAYKSTEFITSTDFSPVPGNSGIITASNIKETSIKIDWTWATDAETASNKLQYRVYTLQKPTIYTINTFADAEIYGTLRMDWQQNMNSFTINELSSASEYYINVFVKDDDGNISSYQVLSAMTLTPINHFPIPGDSGNITPSSIKTDSVEIDWIWATDFETAQNKLNYRVYTLRLPILTPYPQDLDTFAHAEDFGTLQMDWQQNKKNYTINGLFSSTSYVINVFVQDEFGNISPYNAITRTTD